MTRRNLLLLASFVPAVVAACGPFASDDSESDETPGTSAATPDAPSILTLLMPDASGSQTREMAAVLEETDVRWAVSMPCTPETATSYGRTRPTLKP